jgi:hypothetical protein
VQHGGDWPDQPDLQPRPIRTDRAIEVAAIPQLRDRLKNEEENQKRPKTNQPRKMEVRKSPARVAVMNPATPKTELSPSTQPRKVVSGGSHW